MDRVPDHSISEGWKGEPKRYVSEADTAFLIEGDHIPRSSNLAGVCVGIVGTDIDTHAFNEDSRSVIAEIFTRAIRANTVSGAAGGSPIARIVGSA